MNFTYDVSESDFSYEEEGLSFSDTSDRDETTEQEQYDSQSHDSDAEVANVGGNVNNGEAELRDQPIAISHAPVNRAVHVPNRSLALANTARNPADGATSDTDTSSQVVESEDDRPTKRRCVAMDCGATSSNSASTAKAAAAACTSKSATSEQPGCSKQVLSSQGEDGESCPICFESWSNAGEHRLVSLRCGHLFGRSCIMRWLSNQGAKCPQCNRTAKKSDVRILYTKALRALDTVERETALRQLEEERERRQRAELDFAYVKLQYEFSQQECRRLRKELEDERRMRRFLIGDAQAQTPQSSTNGTLGQTSTVASRSAACIPFKFMPFRTVRICESGARVMAYTNQFATLVVSQPSNNLLYPGFGFKRLSLFDLCSGSVTASVSSASTSATANRLANAYVAVHSKPIRDASFQPIAGARGGPLSNGGSYVLLSGSVDKTVKLTSLNSNTVIQTYQCEHPVWSVCWSLDNSNHFFAGLQNGALLLFDIRNTAQVASHLNRLDLDNAATIHQIASATTSANHPMPNWRPTNVVNMHYVEQSSQFRASGLLVGHLDRLVFYERAPSGNFDYVPHLLPVEQRALSSLSFEPTTGHFLATFRPNARSPTVQHQLYVLEKRSLSGPAAAIAADSVSGRRFQAAPQASVSSSTSTSAGPSTTGPVSVVSCHHIATHNAGQSMTFLARNRLFLNPARSNSLLACASDEQSESIHVWDASDSDSQESQLQRIEAPNGTTLDLLPIAMPDAVGEQRSAALSGRFLLAALTEKDVHMHHFVSYPQAV